MVALTALALAAGVGSMAYGAYESSEGKSQAAAGYATQQQGANIEAQAAQQAAQISKDQASASVDYASQQRTINQTAAANSVAAAAANKTLNNQIIGDEQNVNVQQQQAMELDARRQSLQDIRTAQQARATALTTGVAQGGSGFVGASSARGGAYGQISGQTNVNLLGVSQNLQVGENIFGLNTDISNQKIAVNDLQYNYALQQAASQTSEADLTYNYAVTNAGFTDRQADVQVLQSQGQGLISQGGGQVAMGNAQAQTGAQFMAAGPQLFNMGMGANQLFGSQLQTTSQSVNNFWFGGGSPSGYGT